MLRLTKNHHFIIWGGLAALIIAAGVVAIIVAQREGGTATQVSTSSVAPDFPALLPENTSIDSLGGWQQLTPPSGDNFYVYSDTIENVPIKVSQQPLPDSIKGNVTTGVSTIAKGYNASSTLEANETTVYYGSSAQGPQSVIFTKNNLLVLISSEAKIQDSAWISYVTSLR
jgi:hypothetical protein